MSNETIDVTGNKGLAGVAVDSTSISQVQGEAGRLIYRGISIEELAEPASFEEAAFLSLQGQLPTKSELSAVRELLKSKRKLSAHTTAVIDAAPKNAHPMHVLQAATATLSYENPVARLANRDELINQSWDLIAKFSSMVTRISRQRQGLPLIEADSSLNHTDNFYYQMTGQKLDARSAKIFETAMNLHIDHDFNASTFAARVVSSTEATLPAAISAAVGSLSGPLHGGANEKVIEMAKKVGSPAAAPAFVHDALQNKKKVMGFGHRVYRQMDPRAKVLRAMLEEMVQKTGDRTIFDTLLAVHDTMIGELSKKEKDYIWPNVDFWSGALYLQLKIPSSDFTPLFAVARVAGWVSHVVELWSDNRIYRPAAKYIGRDNIVFTPIDRR